MTLQVAPGDGKKLPRQMALTTLRLRKWWALDLQPVMPIEPSQVELVGPGSCGVRFLNCGLSHQEVQMRRPGYPAEFRREVLGLLAEGRSGRSEGSRGFGAGFSDNRIRASSRLSVRHAMMPNLIAQIHADLRGSCGGRPVHAELTFGRVSWWAAAKVSC